MAEPVNLGGWHLAFAITYKDINNEIAAKISALRNSSPTVYPVRLELNQTIGGSNPEAVYFKGNPSAWRLIDGGGQQTVKIGITFDDVEAGVGQNKYAGSVGVIIEALLDVDNGTNNIRVIRAPVANPIKFVWTSIVPAPSSGDLTLINSLLRGWVNGLWNVIGEELMSVDPAITLPNDWGWLSPQNSQAIVSEVGATTDEHQFIIVSMTGTAAPPSSVVIAGSLIPAGSKLGFSIAPAPFLDNVIRKGMDQTFLKTSGDEFTVVDHTLRANQSIDVPQFQIDETQIVNAAFSNVEFTISGERLVFSCHIEFPYQESNINAVNVSMDLRLDYGLELSRQAITQPDNSVIADYPLIQSDPGNFQIDNLVVEATDTFDVWLWAVSFGATLLTTLATAGVGVYRGRQAWQAAQAAPGNNAVQMNQVGGQVAPGNPAQLAGAAAQAAGAAGAGAGQAAPPVMWGVLPRATVLGLIGLGSGWLVTGLLTMTPFWIYLTQSRHAKELVNASMDDAIKTILQSYLLPLSAAKEIKVTSIGLNNSLMIGADPVS